MTMEIELEGDAAEREPGSLLRGRVVLTPLPGHEQRKVELSVLWQTEGKGDTDLGVVLHRVLAEDGQGATGSHDFEVRLPLLPVSYSGTLLKVRWLVRVRRFAPMADDQLEEKDLLVRWRLA